MSTTARFTVGKLDAGMAILLTDDNYLIEFPSLLLPTGIHAGCIVNISVMRDPIAERSRHFAFHELQECILRDYGSKLPEPPVLSCRTVTQTSVLLEWEPLKLHNADLLEMSVYRDGEKHRLNLMEKDATWAKVGGLGVDKDYDFHLRIRTSSGAYTSNHVKVRTHTMENMLSVKVAFGEFERGEREEALEKLKECLTRMGAMWSEEGVTPDVTHVLARVPKGPVFERALHWNVPVVRPEWVFACEQKKRLQPAGAFYLRGASTAASRSSSGAAAMGNMGVVARETTGDTVRSIPEI